MKIRVAVDEYEQIGVEFDVPYGQEIEAPEELIAQWRESVRLYAEACRELEIRCRDRTCQLVDAAIEEAANKKGTRP